MPKKYRQCRTPAATGMMSQRVCAKILEFVFGRSIATNSLEEVGIVFRNPCWNTQFSRINPVGNSRSDLQTVQRHHIAERASRMAVRNSSSSNGLVKKADAPAFREVERTSGSSFPVNMMTRVDGESSRKRDWTSRPFMSGIQT